MSETIEITNWADYFKEFSERNLRRPARLEIFGELGALEEVKQLPLAGIYAETKGENAPRIEILLGGLSATEADYLTHTIPNVGTVLALKDSENQDSALEFVSADGTKTLLSFEATTAEKQTA